jgi:MoaA/NifB/PqqE/SkfB family radical SAM enzyme
MIHSGEISTMVDFVESLNAHSIQLNEIRPVGNAKKNENDNFFLTNREKQILIQYYKEQNCSSRKIAIVMPWYNEEPDRFGCTATSGQHAYVDAMGNVQPCVLLKASLGNIHHQSFFQIWNEFSKKCKHPVKNCIVYPFNRYIDTSEIIPLPPEKTMEVWAEICRHEPSAIFKKIKVTEKVT